MWLRKFGADGEVVEEQGFRRGVDLGKTEHDIVGEPSVFVDGPSEDLSPPGNRPRRFLALTERSSREAPVPIPAWSTRVLRDASLLGDD